MLKAIIGRAVVLDPIEWLITRSIYTRALPQLNFESDEKAALIASKFCKPIDLNHELNWDVVDIIMPPAKTKPLSQGLVVAVEGYSVMKLLNLGIKPSVVVTDFDFQPENIPNCNCLVFGHAHGDNIDRFMKWAQRINKLIPTVQVWPRNCGLLIPGFTDGDRAVYLAYYMGARVINIYGFNKHAVIKRMDEIKRVKLDLAESFINRVLRRVHVNFYP